MQISFNLSEVSSFLEYVHFKQVYGVTPLLSFGHFTIRSFKTLFCSSNFLLLFLKKAAVINKFRITPINIFSSKFKIVDSQVHDIFPTAITITEPIRNLKNIIQGILTIVNWSIETIKIIGPIVNTISLNNFFNLDNIFTL